MADTRRKTKSDKRTRTQVRKLDELAECLRGVPSRRLRDALVKDEMISIRVTAQEKEEMKQMARVLNVTLTEYLCQIHRFVQARLGG